MSARLRAIAYDVDGTLADHFAPPPARVRELVGILEEQGVVQVLVSGKMHEYLGGMARGLGLARCGWVIGENGATVYNWRELKMEMLGEQGEGVEHLRRVLWEEYLDPEEFYEEPKFASVTLFPRDKDYEKALRLLELVRGVVEEEGLQLAPEIHPDSAVDILQEGISKGPALRRVAEYVGVAVEEWVTCGEGINDLEMLKLGYPMAPGDAHERLKEIVMQRGGYVAEKAGPEGLLEGFARLREQRAVEFALPAWLAEWEGGGSDE